MKQLLYLLMLLPLRSSSQLLQIKNNPPTLIDNLPGIIWSEGITWDQIKAKAKEENKYIFIDMYATWCLPCKKMDKEVYSLKEVGDVLNREFISVKVQVDETSHDNEIIKASYPDARYLKEKYKPEGYPCFLFFSPDGKLIHRGIGYQSSRDFISLVNQAVADPIGRYASEIDKFNNSQLKYSDMPMLARMAWKYKEKELSIKIAKVYKEEYLDKLNEENAFNKENLDFIVEFSYELLNSKDKYFQFIYRNGDKVDQIINRQINGQNERMAERVVFMIVNKEEIKEKLYENGSPIKRPNWRKMKTSISNKYGSTFIDKFFPEEQINFYQAAENWKKYIEYVNKKIVIFPPKVDGHVFGKAFGDAWTLNHYAWVLFLNCKNKSLLKKGLSWVDLAIQLEKNSIAKVNYIDTKANLLYRIGKVSEAIDMLRIAIDAAPKRDGYLNTLKKMENGDPTWPTNK